MSNRIKLVALGVIAVLTVAIVWTAANASSGPETSPRPSFAAPTPSAALPAEPTVATYLDQSIGADVPQFPTGRGTQSRLWVAGGSWWAAMLEPKSRTYHIYELVDGGRSWRDTGTMLDDRERAQPDTLWDGTHLYVVSAARSQSASGAARILRFSLVSKDRVFHLDPNFPVTITPTGVDSMVLAKDSLGTLWTTYIGDDGQVMVQRTVGDDLFWSPPAPLPAASSLVSVDDVAQILAFGPGRIGVVWTSRAEGAVYLSSHGDGEPDTTWTAPELAVSGRGLTSNQMRAIAAPDGRLFVTVRTSLSDDPAAGGQSPQILLLARSVGAVWTSALFGRIQDQLGSPLLSLDPETSIVYVMATSPKPGGAIVYKRSPADHPMFAPGAGNPFIADPAAPQTGSGTNGRDPVGSASGLVVLAWDPTSSRYVHGVMDLGRGVAAGPLPAAGTKPGRQLAFEDDFDPWTIGSSPSIGWELRSNDPPKAFTIVGLPSKTDKSARMTAKSVGRDIRACKDFPATTSGDIRIDVKVRLSRNAGTSDAVITEVRGAGIQAASVRFGKNGYFAYFRGQLKARTQVPVRAGVWYRSVVDVHVASRTYDWRLSTASGRGVLTRLGDTVARRLLEGTATARPDLSADADRRAEDRARLERHPGHPVGLPAMRILVTGVAGFVGSHIGERLLGRRPRRRRSRRVHRLLLDGGEGAQPRRAARPVGLHVPPPRPPDRPARAGARGVEAVIHEAAMPGLPRSWQRLRGVPRLQRHGGRSAPRGLPGRRRPTLPACLDLVGLWARGSSATSRCRSGRSRPTASRSSRPSTCSGHVATFGFPAVIVRYFSIFGPRQRPDMAYHRFIEAMLDGRPITVFGDGEQTRSNTFVADAVTGTLAALDGGRGRRGLQHRRRRDR